MRESVDLTCSRGCGCGAVFVSASYEVSQRLAAAEEAKRAAEEERKRAEEAEAREFRKKNMLFRARPVPQTANKPMKLARSKKPLTVPHSPQLGPKGNQENVAVA